MDCRRLRPQHSQQRCQRVVAARGRAAAARAAAGRQQQSQQAQQQQQQAQEQQQHQAQQQQAQQQAQAQQQQQQAQAQQQRLPHQRADLAVVLVHPKIPPNTGNIARTCAATNVALHLVAPGFELSNSRLRRAGLDYWDSVHASTHDSWEAFFERFQAWPAPRRLVGFSVYGEGSYAGPAFAYQRGDVLVFGSETHGLPLQAHRDVLASGGALVRIPVDHGSVRSLNLAVAAGVGLFEALRQLDGAAGAARPARDDARDASVRRRDTPMARELAAAAAAAGGGGVGSGREAGAGS